MQIEFTKEQYENLIMMSELSGWVLGILGDVIEDEDVDYKKMSNEQDKFASYLLEFAEEFGMPFNIEDYGDELCLDEDESEKYRDIMFEFEDYVFWDKLENNLARRDFFRTMTEEEKKEADETGWLPKRFHKIEGKYRKEFEEHGIERLEVRE